MLIRRRIVLGSSLAARDEALAHQHGPAGECNLALAGRRGEGERSSAGRSGHGRGGSLHWRVRRGVD
jgi:hypothetical protein